jgi:hypothetical protein
MYVRGFFCRSEILTADGIALTRALVKPLSHISLLILLALSGCRTGVSSSGGFGGPQPSAAPVVPTNDPSNRLPAPVAAAFHRDHPRSTPTAVHVRLFPDGTLHYQVIYVDGNGPSQQAEYFADGRSVP